MNLYLKMKDKIDNLVGKQMVYYFSVHGKIIKN